MNTPARPASAPERAITLRDGLFAGLPLAALAVLTLACLLTGADAAISRRFYATASAPWPWRDTPLFAWCYAHGCAPAVWLGVAGLLWAIPTFFSQRLRPMRKSGLFLALTLLLGPGLLVNGLLKPAIDRPRPSQAAEFGGPSRDTAAFMRGGDHHSFPSGHASMGFYFMTPALLLYRRRGWLAAGVLAGGLAYGLLIGVARIAQGAHYASDVLGSGLCVWSAALLVLLGRVALKRWLASRHRVQAPRGYAPPSDQRAA